MSEMVALDDLVGLSEIAEERGVPLPTFNTWKYRYREFVPEPVKQFSRGPLYLRDDWNPFFTFMQERGLWTPPDQR